MNEHTNIKPPPLLPEDFQRVFDAWETVGVMVFNSIHGKIAQEVLTRCARPTPPDGMMSAKDLYYWLQLPEARHKHNADVIISAIKARDAQLSQANDDSLRLHREKTELFNENIALSALIDNYLLTISELVWRNDELERKLSQASGEA